MACLRAIAPVRSSLSRPESKIHWIAAVALLISRKIVVACHLPGGWWLGLGSRLGLWPGMAVKGWGLQLKRATAAFTAVLHLFQFAVCVCAARPFLCLCHNSFVLTACRTFLSLEICLPHEAPAAGAPGFPAFPWFFLLLHCPLKMGLSCSYCCGVESSGNWEVLDLEHLVVVFLFGWKISKLSCTFIQCGSKV